MTELTTKDSPVRVVVYEQEKRIIINRPDAVIVLCFVCGGSKAAVMHVHKTMIPPLRECMCDQPEISTDAEDTWASGSSKVESMYGRLKREE